MNKPEAAVVLYEAAITRHGAPDDPNDRQRVTTALAAGHASTIRAWAMGAAPDPNSDVAEATAVLTSTE